MSQHDMDIANQSFPDTRSDINLALKALASLSSGTTAPSTTYANQLWYETDTNTLWLRDETNTAWLSMFIVDQSTGALTHGATTLVQDGTVSAPGLTFAADPDTGFWRNGANAITGVVGGLGALRLVSSGTLRLSSTGGLDAFPAGIAGDIQVHGVGAQAAIALFRASNNVTAPAVNLAKSRGTTAASLTTVQNSDVLGQLNAYGADGSALVQAAALSFQVDKVPSTGIVRAAMRVSTADGAGALQTAMIINSDQAILAASPSGGIGYAAGLGAGGTVTQATNKTTAVTLDKLNGTIVTAATIMAASGSATFTVNNSLVGANDHVEVGIVSPGGGKYRVHRTALAAGSFEVTLQNISGGSLSEAVTIDFELKRGSIT